MKSINKCILLASILVIIPFVVFAQPSQIVPGDCNNEIDPQTGLFTNPCGWVHLVQLGENILNFLVYLAVPVAAIAFTWAGWLYLSARGNPGQISKAHAIFLNVGIGLIIVLVAWLVVDLILTSFADPGTYVQVLTN